MGIIRSIFTVVHLIIIGLLMTMLLNAYIPPQITPYLNLLSLGFPVLMILNIILILFWIVSWRKRAPFFILMSIFFFNATQRWINFNKEKKSGNFKIITLNGHNGNLAKTISIPDYLKKQNPDVVLMQEYHPAADPAFEHRDEAVLTIWSKHKILNHQNLETGNGNSQSFATDIEVNGKPVRFINIYLEPFYFDKQLVKNSAQDELKAKVVLKRLLETFRFHEDQVRIIRKAIETSPYPVIVGGDFNSVPNSFEYYHISENLQDAFVKVGSGSATSFHDYKFPIRIDYLFSSKEIEPTTYKVDRSVKLSDHFPVVATFNFK